MKLYTITYKIGNNQYSFNIKANNDYDAKKELFMFTVSKRNIDYICISNNKGEVIEEYKKVFSL